MVVDSVPVVVVVVDPVVLVLLTVVVVVVSVNVVFVTVVVVPVPVVVLVPVVVDTVVVVDVVEVSVVVDVVHEPQSTGQRSRSGRSNTVMPQSDFAARKMVQFDGSYIPLHIPVVVVAVTVVVLVVAHTPTNFTAGPNVVLTFPRSSSTITFSAAVCIDKLSSSVLSSVYWSQLSSPAKPIAITTEPLTMLDTTKLLLSIAKLNRLCKRAARLEKYST